MQLQPAPARCDGIQRKVGAVRLKLHAGRGRREQTSTVPVEILFLVNMTAQQIFTRGNFASTPSSAAELRKLC